MDEMQVKEITLRLADGCPEKSKALRCDVILQGSMIIFGLAWRWAEKELTIAIWPIAITLKLE